MCIVFYNVQFVSRIIFFKWGDAEKCSSGLLLPLQFSGMDYPGRAECKSPSRLQLHKVKGMADVRHCFGRLIRIGLDSCFKNNLL
jgi:hypothetical protein